MVKLVFPSHHTLGHLHQQHPYPASDERQQHQHHHQSPSRLRRRVCRAIARSAATAAKERSDDNALKDAPKHVIDAVKAESTKPSISSSSVNAVITITDGNLPEHKGPPPVQVQRCPLPSAELTTNQPQLRNVSLQPDGPPRIIFCNQYFGGRGE